MARKQNADQVREEYVDKLGPQLGPIFSELEGDYAWLQMKWREYQVLCGASSKRIELMNLAAGLFFRIIQDTIWEDTLLHLCRLTDPAVMGGKQNLSIQALPELCDDIAIQKTVRKLIEQAVESTSFARDWRNRHIGHRDLPLALGSGTRPLASASRAQVSAAISAIHRVLNEISEQLMDSTLAEDVIVHPTGAEELLYVLRDGLKVEAERRERIRCGKVTTDDLRHDPI